MADENGETGTANDTVLVAYVTVHLESGDSFELLPFEDTHNVKSKVCELMKAWAKSGFLIRGSEIYPWQRVRRIEATRVEEMSLHDSKLQREEWRRGRPRGCRTASGRQSGRAGRRTRARKRRRRERGTQRARQATAPGCVMGGGGLRG